MVGIALVIAMSLWIAWCGFVCWKSFDEDID